MSILIFGGTTEGRLLARELSRRGLPAWVSVATPLGAEELTGLPGITPLVGRKTEGEMAALLRGFSQCVDATHPYAAEVSANIRAACAEAGVPCGGCCGIRAAVLQGFGWTVRRRLHPS